MKRVLLAIASVFTGLTAALCLLISILAFSSANNSNSNLFGGIVIILVMVLPFGILFILSYKHYRNIEPKQADNNASKKQLFSLFQGFESRRQVTEPINFPVELPDGQRLYKKYDRIQICIISGQEPNFKALNLYDDLDFVKEPYNPYDDRAVAVYANGQRIGYIYRGIGQDMTNDFIDNGNMILAKIASIDAKNKTIHMSVAYYYKRRHYKSNKNTPAE